MCFYLRSMRGLARRRGQRHNSVRGQKSIRGGAEGTRRGGGDTKHKRINMKGSGANKCDSLIYLQKSSLLTGQSLT